MKAAIRILALAFTLHFTSCVTLYKPNVIFSPLLKEKGELNTSAALAITGSGLYNLQAAYAVSNHVGIMADGMYHYRNKNYSDSAGKEIFQVLSGEAGAGYYTLFGNDKKGLFQCYAGAGYGGTSDKMSLNNVQSPEVSSKYYNIFLQPGIAFTSNNFEVAFDVRANYVHIIDIHAYLYENFEWWNTDFKFYSDTSFNFLNLEPTVTLKAGGKKLKGIAQVGVTIPTINSKSYFEVNNTSMLIFPLIKFSVGITYTFGRKKPQDLKSL